MSTDVPSRSDRLVRYVSGIVGGPAGRRVAGGAGVIKALPVLLMSAAALMSLALLQKQYCRSNGWSTPAQFWHACYSDIPVLYLSGQLGVPQRPSLWQVSGYGDFSLGQPPLQSAAMWLTSFAADGTGTAAVRRYFDFSAVLMTGLLIVTVIAVALTVGHRRRWDAAHVALAPVVVTAGLASYELLAVALLALALWAWSRARLPYLALAGVFLGLAATAQPVVAIIAVPLLGICVRVGKQLEWLVFAIAGVGTWFIARVALLGSPFADIGDAWQRWTSSEPGYGSIWQIPALLRNPMANIGYTGPIFTDRASSIAALIGLVAVILTVMFVALNAQYRPRVAHLALAALAGALVVGKVYPLQLSLLLLPLIALAGLRWRDHLIWAGAEVAYFVAVWLHIAWGSDTNRGMPPIIFIIILLLRISAVAWIGVQALRMAYHPHTDPVRVPPDTERDVAPQDDPAGGPVALQPDAMIVQVR